MADVKTTHKTNPDPKAQDEELRKPANIPAAQSFDQSGAPNQMANFDTNHPAVDVNPRANTSVLQNRIDFNDPDLEAAAAVTKNLRDQGGGQGPAPAEQKPA